MIGSRWLFSDRQRGDSTLPNPRQLNRLLGLIIRESQTLTLNNLSVRQKLILITLLAIVLRVSWGVVRFNDDVNLVNLGDYDLYEDGAEHILNEGDFTNSLFLVRPPGFPLVIAALGNRRLAVLVFSAVLGGLITPLTFFIAQRLGLSEGQSLLPALLFGVDFIAIAYGAALLDSMAVGNFFAILMMLLLLMAVQAQNNVQALGFGVVAGVSLVISALTRPEIYLIWSGLSLWLVFMYRHRWLAILTYVIVGNIGMSVWAYHNAQVFGSYALSTVGAYTVTFYRAASVERIGSGDPIETVMMNITRRVEEKIGNDPDLATTDTHYGYHAALPDVEAALYAVSSEIFTDYPLIYIATLPVGFIRMYALDPPFLRSTDDPLWMYLAVGWNWLFFLTAVFGFGIAVQQKRWLLAWCVFLAVGYYTAGTLVAKNAGMVGRERAVLTPYMAMVATLAFERLNIWWRAWRD